MAVAEPKLNDEELDRAMASLFGWSIVDDTLTKTFGFADFVEAMRFVNRLAEQAEAAQHHPDIDIRYSKVTIGLSTHDSGGITALDTRMASVADELASA
jgi:4a-hydroxytetrahydrobiopterin dehydratase